MIECFVFSISFPLLSPSLHQGLVVSHDSGRKFAFALLDGGQSDVGPLHIDAFQSGDSTEDLDTATSITGM
jgi:hypothetical protein